MRTHSLVSAAAFSLGLALAANATLLAQEPSDGGPVKRWPGASDRGTASAPAERTAVARSTVPAEAPRPAERASGNVDTGREPDGNRIVVDQGPLEQRRSPGSGDSGGGRDGSAGRGGGGNGGGRVAVPRGSTPSGGGGGIVRGGGGRPGRTVILQPRGYYYPRYYYPYSSYYWNGGYFDTFGYWGNTWGPGYGYGGYPYGYGGYGYRGGYDVGRLRLQVQPRDAEVFIDGYYAGQVDDFDGRLQGLTLETGGYSVEIRKPGWETLTFDVRVTPGRTTNYRGELIPRKP